MELLIRDLKAQILSAEYSGTKQLALQFRPRLEALGRLRRTSGRGAAERRLQEVLRDYVYPLIPEDQLRPEIRNGRRTGGLRR